MKLLEIINEFTVKNIENSIMFYSNYLGFEVVEEAGNPLVKMKKDNSVIMLESYDEVVKEIENYPAKTPTSNLIKFKYDNKEEVSNLYKRFLDNQIKIFMDLKNTEYGTLEFGLLDLDENMIIVSC